MKLWSKINDTVWESVSGKTLSYDPFARLIGTESNGEQVVIPLTVLRSLLEDNGFETHNTDSMRQSRELIDKFLNANAELQFENWEREEDAKEAKQEALSMARVVLDLEQNVETTMNILGDTWEGVHNLKRELKKLRDSVLSFADELITKEVVISSGVIGKFMKERFK